MGISYLFDFDGTLVDSMPNYVATMLRILDENQISYPADIVKIITPLGSGGTARYFIEQLGMKMELEKLGLNSLEINDFLITFLPRMEGNAYNLITFHADRPAVITPAPDTVLRVLMVWKPLDEPMDITPQTLTPTNRTVPTAVLLGGGMVE